MNSTDMKNQRLLSLDVFRGITIAGMILVNSPGNGTAYAPLEHAEWHGWTPTDLIFPFFVFIVGVSLVFSLTKRLERGDDPSDIFRQILKRSAVIFCLGLLLNGFPYYRLETIRIPGVLQRLALCYLFASALFLKTRLRTQLALAGGLLVGYWLLMTQVSVPGFGAGDLSQEGNLAAYIDRALLTGHIYKPAYDPEGILSTLPAVATALLGNAAGAWLLSSRDDARKLKGMVAAGTVSVAAGLLWSVAFPINKALWTSSYVLFTAGLALYLLAFCYWLNDVKGRRGWSKVFEIFGTNAIAAYLLHILFLKLQNLWHMPRMDGTPGNARLFISEHLFSTWTSPQNASLLYALCYTALWAGIFAMLHRKKIFIRI